MDSLSALQFTRVIDKEMKMQSQWLHDMDLSEAKPVAAEAQYHSLSLTQQKLDMSKFQPSKSFRPVSSPDIISKAKSNMGYVYPAYSEITAPRDIRPSKSLFSTVYQGIPEAFRNTERYPNGHKLHQETHRRSGVFGAVIEN